MTQRNLLRHAAVSLTTAVCLVVMPSSLSAQQAEGERVEEAEYEEGHRNSLELSFGGVSETASGNSGFGIGAAYLRRLSERWGLGVLVELTVGGQRPRDFVLAVPAVLYLKRLGFVLAPGFEIKPPGAEGEGEESDSGEGRVEAFLRLGAFYEFELGRYTMALEFNIDIVNFDEVVLVYGIAVGFGF